MIRIAVVGVLVALSLPSELVADQAADSAAASASAADATGPGDAALRLEAMDKAMDDVLMLPAYQWRMPRDSRAADRPAEKGMIVTFLQDAVHTLARAVGWVFQKAERIIDWIGDRIFRRLPHIGRPGHRTAGGRDALTWMLAVLLAAILGVSAWMVARSLRAWRERVHQTEPASGPEPIDLDDERLRADRLPVSDWLTMAAALERDGNSRHAMRALFLAALAYLGQRGWILIASHKSNREYARELERHVENRLYTAFAGCMRLFEQSWYGDNPVLPEQIQQGQDFLQRIMHDTGI